MLGMKRGEFGDLFAAAALVGALLGLIVVLVKWWLT